jgi:hypothetical protein
MHYHQLQQLRIDRYVWVLVCAHAGEASVLATANSPLLPRPQGLTDDRTVAVGTRLGEWIVTERTDRIPLQCGQLLLAVDPVCGRRGVVKCESVDTGRELVDMTLYVCTLKHKLYAHVWLTTATMTTGSRSHQTERECLETIERARSGTLESPLNRHFLRLFDVSARRALTCHATCSVRMDDA